MGCLVLTYAMRLPGGSRRVRVRQERLATRLVLRPLWPYALATKIPVLPRILPYALAVYRRR
eukprot:2100881-Rhodomonas_salina.2